MAEGAVVEFTDGNFEEQVMQADQPVLVDFWAEWCMPCKMLAPTITELAKEFSGRVKVGKLDTDSNREVALKFEISAIPTVILFQDGQVVRKFVGMTAKQEFSGELQKIAG